MVLVGLSSAVPAAAQTPRRFEAGLTSALLLSQPEFFGAGGLVAVRPGGRLRLQFAALAGQASGLAGRAEFTAHFLLAPNRMRGIGWYGFAGIAGTAGQTDAGYLQLGLGIEAAPGGRHGWWMEAGAGGGARIALGWRWRSMGGSPRR